MHAAAALALLAAQQQAVLPQPLDPPPVTAPVAAPAPPPPPALPPAPPGPRRYEDEFVVLEDFPWVSSGIDGTVTTSIRTVAVQGRYRRPLEGTAFYLAVGRPDLATAFEERLTRRNTFIGLGAGVAVLGAIVAVVGASGSGPDVSMPFETFRRAMDEEAARVQRAMVAGGILTLGGLVLAAAGISIDPNPVAAPEARRLADEHNQRLRRELGTAPEPSPEAGAPAAPALSLEIAPSSGGASALLRVTF